MSTPITVNGHPQSVDSSGDTPLLYVQRDELQLNGPGFGCGLSQMWRLHGPAEWPADPLVRLAALAGGRSVGDHARRARHA